MDSYLTGSWLSFVLSLSSCFLLIGSFWEWFSLGEMLVSLIFLGALAGFDLGFIILIKNSESRRQTTIMILALLGIVLGFLPFISLLANKG